MRRDPAQQVPQHQRRRLTNPDKICLFIVELDPTVHCGRPAVYRVHATNSLSGNGTRMCAEHTALFRQYHSEIIIRVELA